MKMDDWKYSSAEISFGFHSFVSDLKVIKVAKSDGSEFLLFKDKYISLIITIHIVGRK